MAPFRMEGPSFSLDVDLQVPAPVPVVVPGPVPNYEELTFELGLNNAILDTNFIAMLSMLESGLNLSGGDDETQASQVIQFLSENPEFQWVLAQGGSNPSWAVDRCRMC